MMIERQIIKENRIGKIKITRELLHNEDCKNGLNLVFNDAVRAEYLGYSDMIEYVLFKKEFEKNDIGCIVPEYSVQVEHLENGNINITFIKQGDFVILHDGTKVKTSGQYNA